MAKDGKEVNHECVYRGEHNEKARQPVEKVPTAPPEPVARLVALSVLAGHRGSYRPSGHFNLRRQERNFDVFDIEYAIRNGKCIESGKYSEDNKNHEFVYSCNIDGVDFEAVFALSAIHDLIEAPLMVLMSGIWKTKSGKRLKRY